jgi:flavin-dependent dehydrogenase
MIENNQHFDVAIIGGGLAGLALSIQLGREGYNIALFEKEEYPFHKVCGEYISMESWAFIESLGLPLSTMNLPIIKNLIVTSPNGNMLTAKLPLGGFGISRYNIDDALKKIAIANNVAVYEKCKVEEVAFADEVFTLDTGGGFFTSKLCCGSYGKRSNIDIKWKRYFVSHKNNKLSNYVGVKYHIKTLFASDTIALHNFKNGYCGISKIDEDKFCLCYLTNAANLKENDNSIEALEKNVLKQNPHLKTILDNCEHMYPAPVTISQISFSHKTQVENHVLLLGDAAGSITPLCGNGMSMALHASKIAASLILHFLGEEFDRKTLEKNYKKQWKQLFAKRLFIGRMIQHLFGEKWVTNLFVMVMKTMPWLTRLLIKQTHGKAF